MPQTEIRIIINDKLSDGQLYEIVDRIEEVVGDELGLDDFMILTEN